MAIPRTPFGVDQRVGDFSLMWNPWTASRGVTGGRCKMHRRQTLQVKRSRSWHPPDFLERHIYLALRKTLPQPVNVGPLFAIVGDQQNRP
jgi:hypothetical protein